MKNLILTVFLILSLSISAVEAASTDEEDSVFSLKVDLPDEEDSFAETDLEALFTDEDMIEQLDDADEDSAPAEELLKNEELIWGGIYRGKFTFSYDWDNIVTEEYDPLTPTSKSLTPVVSGNLYFDSRPDTEFRVFGKFKLTTEDTTLFGGLGDIAGLADLENISVETDENDNFVINFGDPEEEEEEDSENTAGEEEPGTGTPPSITISVFELFSDFSYKDTLFFRFGKHTIKWGVGYFWSPADILNLTSIDVENPDQDREGPVSLKTHIPFNLNNSYLFLIANEGIEPSETAVAPKFEFVLGGSEIGIGAYYQKALAPRAVVMITSSVRDFNIFTEGVVSYGSDKTFIRRSKDQSAAEQDVEDDFEIVLDTYTLESIPVFSGTAGFSYMHEFENNAGSLMLMGQYLFNGEGYKDSSLLKAGYYLLQNTDSNGLALPAEEQPEDYIEPPAIGFGDLTNFGQHYGALIINWNNIFNTDLNFTAFAMANFSDLSGIVSPSLSYTFFNRITLSTGFRVTFGNEGDELTNPAALFSGGENQGPTLSITIDASIGGGSF